MSTSRISFVASVTSTEGQLEVILQDLRTRERVTCTSWETLVLVIQQLLDEQQKQTAQHVTGNLSEDSSVLEVRSPKDGVAVSEVPDV